MHVFIIYEQECQSQLSTISGEGSGRGSGAHCRWCVLSESYYALMHVDNEVVQI